MSSYTGLSPKQPNRYVGKNVYLSSIVTRNREPTSADYRQPETGKLYPTGSFWLVGENPTTGTQGDFWYLSKISANVAFWNLIGSGASGSVITLTGDSGGAINPDADGNINLIGGGDGTGIVTAGTGHEIDFNVYRWVAPSSNNWTPVVAGSSSAGTATYIKQHGVYSRIGNMIYFTFDLEWTNHTGTGDMRITGFPKIFALANTNYPVPVFFENISLPANTVQVEFVGENEETYGTIYACRDGTTKSAVQISAAGTVAAYSFYFSDQP